MINHKEVFKKYVKKENEEFKENYIKKEDLINIIYRAIPKSSKKNYSFTSIEYLNSLISDRVSDLGLSLKNEDEKYINDILNYSFSNKYSLLKKFENVKLNKKKLNGKKRSIWNRPKHYISPKIEKKEKIIEEIEEIKNDIENFKENNYKSHATNKSTFKKNLIMILGLTIGSFVVINNIGSLYYNLRSKDQKEKIIDYNVIKEIVNKNYTGFEKKQEEEFNMLDSTNNKYINRTLEKVIVEPEILKPKFNPHPVKKRLKYKIDHVLIKGKDYNRIIRGKDTSFVKMY